jgi:endonuclease G
MPIRINGGAVVGKTVTTGAGALALDITTLEKKYGWAAGGWPDKLIRAADANGTADGKVSAAEVDAYLANPKDLAFLTSDTMVKLVDAVGTGASATTSFQTAGQRALAQAADGAGNRDGRLSQSELTSYLDAVKASRTSSLWVPDQKAAVLDSELAAMTGEANTQHVGGALQGTELLRNYMRIVEDNNKRVPRFVSYVLTAADVRETPLDLKRMNNFHPDKDYPNSPTLKDYEATGFDRGHQKPAEDSPNAEAMSESFLLTNMAPQTKSLNEQVWQTLEQATNELVRATGGKATIITGSLFLGPDGNPLPPEKIQRLNHDPNGVAIPTHSFKAVLLEQPNGALTMYAYNVPNRPDVPTDNAGMKKLLDSSRVSVDQIEKLLGNDLFADLPAAVQAKLESNPAAKIAFQNASEYHAASLLWPQPLSPAMRQTDQVGLPPRIFSPLWDRLPR